MTIRFRVISEFIKSQQQMGREIFSSKMFLDGEIKYSTLRKWVTISTCWLHPHYDCCPPLEERITCLAALCLATTSFLSDNHSICPDNLALRSWKYWRWPIKKSIENSSRKIRVDRQRSETLPAVTWQFAQLSTLPAPFLTWWPAQCYTVHPRLLSAVQNNIIISVSVSKLSLACD